MSGIYADRLYMEAQEVAWRAERSETLGHRVEAKMLWLRAAQFHYDVVLHAIAKGIDDPEARGTVAVSAVALAARSLDLDQAITYANNLLSKADAFSPRRAAELRQLLEQYEATKRSS